jgi:hypothetical protein
LFLYNGPGLEAQALDHVGKFSKIKKLVVGNIKPEFVVVAAKRYIYSHPLPWHALDLGAQ